MSADEMFEKLGHTKVRESPFGVKYNTMYYCNSGDEVDWSIEIDKDFKEISLAQSEITIDELKAIYQKCKEMGMIE